MINTDTQFYKDLTDASKVMKVNTGMMALGYWNLIVSIRDCGLYSVGIKPHRNWRLSDVKSYFGVKGTAAQIKSQLEKIRDVLKG